MSARPPELLQGLVVLHVTASPLRRGAETFATQLSDTLASAGWTSSTCSVSGAPNPDNLTMTILGPTRVHPQTLYNLARAVRSSDVVVAHGSDSLLPVAVLSLLLRRPFVYRVIGDPEHWGAVSLAEVRIGRPLRGASAVVALTDRFAAILAARYRVDPGVIVTSPNAVDASRFAPAMPDERAMARAEFGLPEGATIVGYLGSLSEEKRPEWAIDAVAAIPGVHLVVGGAGPMRDELERRADRVAPGRVTFLGTVAEPARFLHSVDLLVLPSRTEGMPGVVIEAALCAVPTVATDVGGVQELVDGVGFGRVVDRDNLGAFTAATAELALAVGASPLPRPVAAERLRPFTFEAVGSTWSVVLQRVVADSRRSRLPGLLRRLAARR